MKKRTFKSAFTDLTGGRKTKTPYCTCGDSAVLNIRTLQAAHTENSTGEAPRFPGLRLTFFTVLYLLVPSAVIQFLALFLLIVFSFSWYYSRLLYSSIVVDRTDAVLRGFKNGWLEVELAVKNKSRFPVFMLSVNDAPGHFMTDEKNRRLFNLPGRSHITITYRIRSADRGLFTCGPATVRGSDPLGLYPFSFMPEEKSNVIIYPASAFADIKSPAGLPLGSLISPNPLYEDITRYRSVRDYICYDDPRRINWKVSARSGKLAVNEYDPTFSWPVTIFLNLNPAEYPIKLRRERMERAVEAAAAFCLMAARSRQSTGIIICANPTESCFILKPAAGTLNAILEKLAAAGMEEQQSPARKDQPDNTHDTDTKPVRVSERLEEKTAGLPFGTRLIYTGPELTEEEYTGFYGLKKRNITCEFAVLSERRLPSRVPGNLRLYQITEEGYEIF